MYAVLHVVVWLMLPQSSKEMLKLTLLPTWDGTSHIIYRSFMPSRQFRLDTKNCQFATFLWPLTKSLLACSHKMDLLPSGSVCCMSSFSQWYMLHLLFYLLLNEWVLESSMLTLEFKPPLELCQMQQLQFGTLVKSISKLFEAEKPN